MSVVGFYTEDGIRKPITLRKRRKDSDRPPSLMEQLHDRMTTLKRFSDGKYFLVKGAEGWTLVEEVEAGYGSASMHIRIAGPATKRQILDTLTCLSVYATRESEARKRKAGVAGAS